MICQTVEYINVGWIVIFIESPGKSGSSWVVKANRSQNKTAVYVKREKCTILVTNGLLAQSTIMMAEGDFKIVLGYPKPGNADLSF